MPHKKCTLAPRMEAVKNERSNGAVSARHPAAFGHFRNTDTGEYRTELNKEIIE